MSDDHARDADVPPHDALLHLGLGYMATQVVYTMARLNIAGELGGRRLGYRELAHVAGAHAPSLLRLLRAATELGVVSEPEPGQFELTPVGKPLRADAPGSIRKWILLYGAEPPWRAWGNLLHSVLTGECAFEHVFGTDIFNYNLAHPEIGAVFHAGIVAETEIVAAALPSAYDLSPFKTLVDVGGGNGTMVAALLTARPELRGVVFDTPDGCAEAPKVLAAAGVAGRCHVVTGDFFAEVPALGDVYLLKSTIHDWHDDEVVQILTNCRRAMPPDGCLLLLERVLPAPPGKIQTSWKVRNHLNMLVMTGGRERTESEFAHLLGRSGFALTSVSAPVGATDYRIVAARPV